MSDSLEPQAKVCLTAAGVLVHEGKVLLIKHKKLGMWLNPGGHLEENELPHQAAEREFWEETGLKVKAKPFGFMFEAAGAESVPSPFLTDLHWVSRENYDARVQNNEELAKNRRYAGRACEQHACFAYLVVPTADLDFAQNVEETDGIAWFGLSEVDSLETTDSVKLQLKEAIRLSQV